MVNLSCTFDSEALAEEIAARPPYSLRGVLVETYFVVPLAFSVDGVDLMKSPNGWHLDVPLLHFVTKVLPIVDSLATQEEQQIYLVPGGGGYLKFTRARSDAVEVYSSVLGHSVLASSAELVEALTAFSADEATDETEGAMADRVPILERVAQRKR